MRLTSGKIKRPQKVVVYGPEGIGKSSLGAAFPGALLLDVENGSGHLDCDRIIVDSLSDVNEVLDQLFSGHGSFDGKEFRSVVIDTADWLEQLIVKAVCDQAEVNGIEDIGFGKGYVYVSEDMMTTLNKLDQLVNIGMNVLIVAHSQVKKREEPGTDGAYDRYELKCSKRITALLMEWSDAVLFINYKVTVEKDADGKTRATGGTDRLLMTEHTAAFDAKNRWGLPAEVKVGPEEDPLPAEILEHLQTEPFEAKAEPVKKAGKPALDPKSVDSQLKALMDANEVTTEEIKAVLKKQGVKKVTEKVKQNMVDQFDKVLKQIIKNRT